MSSYIKEPTAVCDIDGVLATGTVDDVYSDKAGWAYEKCAPISVVIKALQILKRNGVRIIVFTSRFEEDREKTVQWLLRHEVPYDELRMDKPYGHVYIDDRSFDPFNPNDYLSAWEIVGRAMERMDELRCK